MAMHQRNNKQKSSPFQPLEGSFYHRKVLSKKNKQVIGCVTYTEGVKVSLIPARDDVLGNLFNLSKNSNKGCSLPEEYWQSNLAFKQQGRFRCEFYAMVRRFCFVRQF